MHLRLSKWQRSRSWMQLMIQAFTKRNRAIRSVPVMRQEPNLAHVAGVIFR